MIVQELIEWLTLGYHNEEKTVVIEVEGYGKTESDYCYCVNFDKEKVIISIAKPTKEDYKEGEWVK